jgi:hypothetical protein
MNKLSTTKPEASPLTTVADTKSDKSPRGTKLYLTLMHMIESPQGVSEKSINAATRLMSGRNEPTRLKRKHHILLADPKLRRLAPDGSHYTVYQLLNSAEARKLAALILHHCRKHKISPPAEERLHQLAARFPDRAKNKAA